MSLLSTTGMQNFHRLLALCEPLRCISNTTNITCSELLWSVYGLIQALENSHNPSYNKLAAAWQKWLDYTKTTAAKVSF